MNGPSPDERNAAEIDPGEPIPQLTRFEHETSAGLLTRIRRSIQRRSTVAQLTSFTASVPLVVLKEFWLILVGQFNQKSARKDVTHGEEAS
jgi:hypothetical protein